MADEWWQQAFADLYLEIYAHRDDAAAEREVAAIRERLAAAPGPILDACCGGGRHLAAMRAQGLSAYGFDWSPHLLAQAYKREQLHGSLFRADMRRVPLQAVWGAITLFFTAFGYFSDDDNELVLYELAQLIRPGGWIMLDIAEPEHLQKNLVAMSERHLASGIDVLEQRRLVEHRVEKTVTAKHPNGRFQRYVESVRLYQPDEIEALAQRVGLHLVEIWPSLLGATHSGDRQVCWLQKGSS